MTRWLASWRDIDVRLVAAVVAVTSLILGFIGLAQYLPHQPASAGYGTSFWDIVYYDLQLYAFASAPAAGRGPFPVWLEIARFLAPLGTLLVALAALRLVLADQFRRYLAARASGHAIVVGDDSVALVLARNLGKAGGDGEGKRVVLLSASDNMLIQARRYDILTVRGDPTDEATLSAAGVARAAELYACTSQSTVNAAIALRARDQVSQAAKRPLAAYALVRDAELSVALRARRVGVGGDPRLRLDFFAIEGIAARKLFDKHPLALAGGSPVQVVISGFGQLGQAVLRELAHRRQMLPGDVQVKVVIRHAAKEEVTKVTGAFPVIGDNCSITYDDAPGLSGASEYTVYVCLDGDDDALREGLAIAHSLASQRAHVVPLRCAVRCLQFSIVLVQLDGESFDLSVAHAVGNQTKSFRTDGGPNGAHGPQPRILVRDLLDHERPRRFGDVRGNRRKGLGVRTDAAEDRKAIDIKRHPQSP